MNTTLKVPGVWFSLHYGIQCIHLEPWGFPIYNSFQWSILKDNYTGLFKNPVITSLYQDIIVELPDAPFLSLFRQTTAPGNLDCTSQYVNLVLCREWVTRLWCPTLEKTPVLMNLLLLVESFVVAVNIAVKGHGGEGKLTLNWTLYSWDARAEFEALGYVLAVTWDAL